jgi:ABC-type branched-subunit amino acid transport system substrate-binding protein
VLAQVAVLPHSDFDLLLTAALRAGRPDVIVMAARGRATGTVAALTARLLPGVPIVAGDGALVPEQLIRYAGLAVDRIHAVAFWIPDPADPIQREFVDAFHRTTGRDPDANDAMLQDGMMLLAAAIDEVGPDPAAVREWLISLGRYRPPFPGVTGPVTFGTDRIARLRMAHLEGGRPVPEPAR